MTPHIQAIANTAAFHFAFIEQGGSSLYAAMAQKATSLEALRIIVSIGPTETAHFQTWHDKARQRAGRDRRRRWSFPDLEAGPFESDELFKKNLIMPEPCDVPEPLAAEMLHRSADGDGARRHEHRRGSRARRPVHRSVAGEFLRTLRTARRGGRRGQAIGIGDLGNRT